MLALLPLNGFIFSRMMAYTIQTSKQTDIRVKLVNEILSGIKVIKMYAWEAAFKKRLAVSVSCFWTHTHTHTHTHTPTLTHTNTHTHTHTHTPTCPLFLLFFCRRSAPRSFA